MNTTWTGSSQVKDWFKYDFINLELASVLAVVKQPALVVEQVNVVALVDQRGQSLKDGLAERLDLRI